MEHYNDYCKLIDSELSKIAKKPELDINTLHNLGELLDAKKDLLEILEKEQMLEGGGQSMRYMPRDIYYDRSYANGNNMGGSSGYYPGYSMANGNGGQSGHFGDYDYQRRIPMPQDDMIRRDLSNKMYN